MRPDGKTQVTVEYDEKDKPFRLDAVVLSTQHDPDITQGQIQLDIKKYVFDEILPGGMAVSYTHLDVYKRQQYGVIYGKALYNDIWK